MVPLYLRQGYRGGSRTCAQCSAEILSYSRTQGLFAGVNLSGGIVKPGVDDNVDLYGPKVSAKDVVMGTTVSAPPSTAPFMDALSGK